ncbi:hypothetical protein FE236_01755 [Mariprofundus erugo]|uniref:hypothetical protein n=1 Tax=Mariprofundus erugo TaxID=2528639 RepID=UPI0010FE9931|nr:hypothetical protein [Mariprofundus erugo]TLS77860.1 hypothetical protein FE236_01755 [Mariprofundus erugo]
MKWLDELPYPALIAMAILMALLPFEPEPHLSEKLRMLATGVLSRPIDIFDLLWHLLPTILIGVKLFRARRGKRV